MNTERLLTLAVVATVIVGISCQAGQGVGIDKPKTPYCYPKCLEANERCITLARCPFAQPAKCNRCAVTKSIVCPAKESGNTKQLLMLLGELLKNQYKQVTTPAPNNNNDLFGFGGSSGRGGKRSSANDFMTMFAMNSMFRR